jgi:hypothetical protein
VGVEPWLARSRPVARRLATMWTPGDRGDAAEMEKGSDVKGLPSSPESL